jgi:hypothetical protein
LVAPEQGLVLETELALELVLELELVQVQVQVQVLEPVQALERHIRQPTDRTTRYRQ